MYNSKMYDEVYISSGARSALPMGVAPEATTKCLYLVVGLTSIILSLFYRPPFLPFLFLYFSLFLLTVPSLFHFIGCATSAPDGSSPRGYDQVFALYCRLNLCYFSPTLFCPSPPCPLITSINNTSDKSSPQAYEQMLVFDYGLPKFSYRYI
jgi:hypothetical protein